MAMSASDNAESLEERDKVLIDTVRWGIVIFIVKDGSLPCRVNGIVSHLEDNVKFGDNDADFDVVLDGEVEPVGGDEGESPQQREC